MEKEMYMPIRPSSKLSKALLVLGLSLGYFMVLLDTTIISVALPAIHADLGGGIIGLQWTVNAYTIVFAGLLLLMGSLADKLGAKRVYIAGLFIFLAASAISTFVSSLAGLIFIRAALGIGGAALLPASLTLLSHTYPAPAERARALGIWAAVTGLSMAAGPVVGGFLVDMLGWRSIFLLNVPLAMISIVATIRLVPETKPNFGKRLDPTGQITIFTAITAWSFGLMEGGAIGWSSPVILTAFGIALAATLFFLLAETKGATPMLPLYLFRNANIAVGMLAGMAINLGLSGILFLLPFYFQQVRGFSAQLTGLALLPMTVPLAFNPIVTGRIVGRIGARLPMSAGLCLTGLGTWLQVWANANTSYALTLASLLLIGFGVSFTIPSLMTSVISSVPNDLTGTASGALNASRQLGATIGVAIMGSILSASLSFLSGMHVSLVVLTVILLGTGIVSFVLLDRSSTVRKESSR
ncbi:MFS transporter [Brevibacillus nitrificans]|uniref:MFS transporter n=1 Tax=Brevibacillus nitrificans TaxID=651560 RepID=UPI00262EA54E|nr:MFS transporter [Brevibacillus nitrificans]